ncbi:TIGR03089 family protein [Arthrobacter sp. CJ23]|uniref:TIGR03089 family protein n=1 Tax=Arthrobacter sp. CJ23 TaxID=2972479 RepID=UPI00215D2C31|nr:TIGR03089 family protein [Arthrobacter sp. CJ23]UVJ40699.1 TIGR03089 family protein [Arthrobacter sp. CJ23]
MSIPAMKLMTALRSGHATYPRLTWYGPDSERVELSGRVLDNWVAKTSNLLQDELDAEPGMSLRVDLPAHWKSFVWALAGWQLGMELVLDGGDAELLVTDTPEVGSGGFNAVVAVPLAALAMRWPGELPAGVVDYAAEVRSHGDVFMAHNEPEEAMPALRGSAAHHHGGLLDGFAQAQEPGVRLLVRAGVGLETALAAALGAWMQDGSVVLVHPDVDVTQHLLDNERVSAS